MLKAPIKDWVYITDVSKEEVQSRELEPLPHKDTDEAIGELFANEPLESQDQVQWYRKSMFSVLNILKRSNTTEMRAIELKQNYAKWAHILTEWNKYKDMQVTKDLLWAGVGPKVRGTIWMKLIANPMHITKTLFQVLQKRARNILEEEFEVSGFIDLDAHNKDGVETVEGRGMADILIDIKRTFPQIKQFNSVDGVLCQPLLDVLTSFVCLRPDLGYHQGMSLIAATLLLATHDPNDLHATTFNAFVAFTNLIHTDENFAIYGAMNDPRKYIENENSQLFAALFDKHLPQLSARLKRLNIKCSKIAQQWMIPIFTRELQTRPDMVIRIWDNYLLHGPGFLFQTCLAILKVLSAKLMIADHDECFAILLHPSLYLEDLGKLFHTIRSLEASRTDYYRLRREIREKSDPDDFIQYGYRCVFQRDT